ncbi:mechanosensitive ion channel family protein [Mycetohabitans sp. B2]|uniref:mechanosensitive ion channel family protein n=1 Tax=Mycetohabitans sp. B2 TaxID=2841274 RepID=UPI001F011B08|nr:mechanosensitive ion channel domain-containing protein [Mycetohabitans sp. B2]
MLVPFRPPLCQPARQLAWVATVFVVMVVALSVAVRVSAAPTPAPSAAASPSSGTPATPASNAVVALTPEQARAALQVLNDPRRRAQFEDTLRAIAAAGTLASPTVPPPLAVAASAPPAASGPAGSLAKALDADGLVTQLSRHIAQSASTFGQRVRLSSSALLDFPSVRQWWAWHLSSPQGRHTLLGLLELLLAALVPSLMLEMLVRRTVRRSRSALAAHHATPHEPPAPSRQSDLRPGDASAPRAFASHAAHHWSRLQVLPRALVHLLLGAVPLTAFALCASMLLSVLDDSNTQAASAVGVVVDAYVIGRAVLLACAFFFAPNAPHLRLLPLQDRWASFAQGWMTRIVVVAGASGALAGAAGRLGMTQEAQLALVKLVALAVHIMAAIAILQCRVPVARAIRGYFTKRPALAYLGHWLADIWAGSTVFVILALWLVWALDVRHGYEMVLHLGGLSLAVLLAARVVAIVVFGALGRVFGQGVDDSISSVGRRRAYRYYPLLRKVLSVVIGVATLLVLLSIWGLHVGTFLVHNPIGNRLGSALVTIAIAALVAVLVWEIANVGAERRLERWTAAGDVIRAARLRTLLPMLRTTLFIATLMIVGLTALSQIGVNTGPLLAGASIFGVALGFGSQKLVQDFITGIFLLMENAMQVGDWVTVAGVSGSVEYLSIRTVRLRGGDGSLYTVPFSSVTTVNNTNRGIGNAAVKVVIAAGADVQYAIQTLVDIGAELRSDDKFKDGILSDFSFWGVDQIDGASITLVGQIACRDTRRWPVQREFNRRVLERFTERGIELANPQRNFVIDARATAQQPSGPDAGTSPNR